MFSRLTCTSSSIFELRTGTRIITIHTIRYRRFSPIICLLLNFILAKIAISRRQTQIYLHFVEAKCSVSEIVKGEVNRAGLHAKIAEPHPIFYKDSKNNVFR